jgi:phage N-6-adenine-methyltransferase
MNTELMFSSKNNEWETPQTLFDELNKEFNFTLDPCSTHKNHKCNKYFTIEEDGLKQDWSNERPFVNPPYGRELGKWVEKCRNEYIKGTNIVLLIPSRTDTAYQHNYIFPYAKAILFVKGRLKFGESKNAAPFPSQIVLFVREITDEQKEILKKYGKLVIL